MLGVQSNSYEDLMSKISITTSNFIIVKKFYFPSMKRILLEVIYRLLRTEKNIYLFGHNFLKTVIQNIQVYGLSLEKFRRIIHFLLASNFFKNDYFYINALLDKGINEEISKDIIVEEEKRDYVNKILLESITSQNNNLYELENLLKYTQKFLKEEKKDHKTEAEVKEMV